MPGKVRVETQQLRAVGNNLEEVAARFDAVLSKVRAASAAHWGKWGDDEFGKSFAKSENGYENSDHNLQAVLASKSALLHSHSKWVTDTANKLELTEFGNTEVFKRLIRRH
ncbi:hypothetical protein ACQP1G_16600 [Nocardia sp. CA-107356]|uniref:hypothetical protein n=1 Tax=Nocardia sp. CA-107356 TaxID=3239972 RepID=UPI003D8F05FD